jgi:hypothetical protein
MKCECFDFYLQKNNKKQYYLQVGMYKLYNTILDQTPH